MCDRNSLLLLNYIRYIFEIDDIYNTYPLTSNADYMNMIEFNKGCYIGQEPNARQFYNNIHNKKLCTYIVQNKKIDNYYQSLDQNIYIISEYIDMSFEFDLRNLEILNN